MKRTTLVCRLACSLEFAFSMHHLLACLSLKNLWAPFVQTPLVGFSNALCQPFLKHIRSDFVKFIYFSNYFCLSFYLISINFLFYLIYLLIYLCLSKFTIINIGIGISLSFIRLHHCHFYF